MPRNWLLLYASCCGFVLANAAGGYARGTVEIDCPEAWMYGLFVPLYLVGGWTALQLERAADGVVRDFWRAAGLCFTGLAVSLLPVLALLLSSNLNAQHTAPWTVDPWLAWPEELLGVHQVHARALAERWGWMPLLVWAYGSNRWQARCAVLWHGIGRQDLSVVYEVATAFALCAAVAQPLYLMLPADGPAVHYGWTGDPPSFLAGWYSMRPGSPWVITYLDGYMSAPSFHAVMAGLLIRLWWDSPFRIASWILNAIMLAATWVVGWHYATDIVLGGILVSLALLAVRRIR